MNLPNHIAIIMDGNGRWGKKKFNNRLLGHEKGIDNISLINTIILRNSSFMPFSLTCLICLLIKFKNIF